MAKNPLQQKKNPGSGYKQAGRPRQEGQGRKAKAGRPRQEGQGRKARAGQGIPGQARAGQAISAGGTTRQAVKSINVPALTANIFEVATNSTKHGRRYALTIRLRLEAH